MRDLSRLQRMAKVLERANPVLRMGSWRDCACGYAARKMPEFQAQGFRYKEFVGILYGKHSYSTSAVGAFFNLTDSEVNRLFCFMFGTTDGRWIAAKINQFIQHQQELENANQKESAEPELCVCLEGWGASVCEPQRSDGRSAFDHFLDRIMRPAVNHDQDIRAHCET